MPVKMPWFLEKLDPKMNPENSERLMNISQPDPRKRMKSWHIGMAAAMISMGMVIWVMATLGPRIGVPAAQWYIPKRFPDVIHLAPEKAQEMRQYMTNIVFVDVRNDEEWLMSHIPNSIHVPDLGQIQPEQESLMREAEAVIFYCAAGYRSAVVCENWQSLGHTNGLNLNGALFAWAHQGYPISGDKVHPFSKFARWMVRPDLRP
jgi:rhodanese-related sulfurtransferase